MTLVLFLVAKIFAIKLTYGESYKVGLYTITLGLLINALLSITEPILHLHGFVFMVTLISVGVFVANFKKKQSVKKSK